MGTNDPDLKPQPVTKEYFPNLHTVADNHIKKQKDKETSDTTKDGVNAMMGLAKADEKQKNKDAKKDEKKKKSDEKKKKKDDDKAASLPKKSSKDEDKNSDSKAQTEASDFSSDQQSDGLA